MSNDPPSPPRTPPSRALARGLSIATPVVAIAGLGAELSEYTIGADERAVELFSLSYEANVPTWYASVLLFSCAALLATTARAASSDRARWWALSAIFAYMSLDEAIEIHEYLGWLVEGDGVLYFAWVIPAAGIVAALGVAFLPFLRRLPRRTRNRFLGAGALYVGGALLMELPLGWWVSSHGDDNLGYGLIDWVEETMELGGASWFAVSVAQHRERLRSGS